MRSYGIDNVDLPKPAQIALQERLDALLVRSHGYDTKHAMHLVRLMRMGLEVLRTSELRSRPVAGDGDESCVLKAARAGHLRLLQRARTSQLGNRRRRAGGSLG